MTGRNINRDEDKKVVKKAKEDKKSPVKKVRGLKSLPDKIETARQAVENYLGDKRDMFKCVTSKEELRRYVDCAVGSGYIAIDTETTSLDVFTCNIVGFSLYTEAKAPFVQLPPCYIPLSHVDYITGNIIDGQMDKTIASDCLQEMVDNGVKFIFFNADFDIRVILHTLGVRITPFFDCYIAARLLNENEDDNGLKALHKKYVLNVKEEEFKFGELFEKIPFDLIPIDVAYLYGAKDALVTFELFKFQLPYLTLGTIQNKEQELEGVSNVFWKIEMPIVPIVIDMEEAGVKFDFEYQAELSKKYNEELKKHEEEYYELLKKYTNNVYSISSPKQLQTLFYDELKVLQPVFDKKKGEITKSVDVNALSSIKHPLAEKILEYRAFAKMVSTYVDKLSVLAERDGRVHGLFNQVGTDTGRFSSKDPNLQNIPSHNSDVRKMFVPSNGYVFVGGDFSAQEVRVVADMCGDEGMIQAYKDGKDLYCEIASMSFHVPYEQCKEFNPDGTTNKEGKERRSTAKKIVLSINYGKGITNLAEDLGKSRYETQKIYSAVMDAYPKLKQFIANSKQLAGTRGYVTTKFGRKRRLVDCLLPHYEFRFTDGGYLSEKSEIALTKKLDAMYYKDRMNYIEELKNGSHIIVKDNNGFIARAERQCVNARVQGTSADMVKIVMQIISKDEVMQRCKFRLLLQVHDELIGECPLEHAKEARDRLKYIMEHCMDGVMQVPLKADVSVTDRWYGEELVLD